MRLSRRLLPAVLLWVLVPACAARPDLPPSAPAAPATAVQAPLQHRLDSLVRAAYPADGPGAAVLVRRGAEVLLRDGYGLANVELAVPVRPEHVFRIGSVTKQFTAVAILKLAEQGRLAVSDEVTKYLPEVPTHGQRLTIEHLLTHTGGLASYTDLESWRATWRNDLSVGELIALTKDEAPRFAPGERWAYNNSGYVMLGAIIEKVSGRSYEEYVEQELFAPLGLARTRYGHNEELVPGLVTGYARDRSGWVPAPYLSLTHPFAAGSLLSSVDDIDAWLRAVRDGKVVSRASLERAWTPAKLRSGLATGYGYGWMMGTAWGRPTIEHSGGIHGFSAYQVWLPEEDLHVVVLTNASPAPRSPTATALELARIALGAPPVPAAIAIAPEALQQYVGVYQASGGERHEVVRRGDSLFTRVNNAALAAMVPVAADEFVVPSSQNRLVFERPSGGPVTGVRLRPRAGPESLAPRIAAQVLEQPEVTLAPDVLDRYVGTYQLQPGFDLVVTREGAQLITQATGQQRVPLRATSRTEFVPIGIDARLVFQLDTEGRATAVVLHQGGRTITAPRK